MKTRDIASAAVAAATLVMAAVPLVGQSQSDASKVISAQLAAPAKGFVQPKTDSR